MFRPDRAGIDPPSNQRDLIARERFALRRHMNFRVQTGHISIQQALPALSWNDRFAGVTARHRFRLRVEPEAALLFVGSMTRITTVSEDRLDIACEIRGLVLGECRKRLSRGNPDKSGLKPKPRENRERCDEFVRHEKLNASTSRRNSATAHLNLFWRRNCLSETGRFGRCGSLRLFASFAVSFFGPRMSRINRM